MFCSSATVSVFSHLMTNRSAGSIHTAVGEVSAAVRLFKYLTASCPATVSCPTFSQTIFCIEALCQSGHAFSASLTRKYSAGGFMRGWYILCSGNSANVVSSPASTSKTVPVTPRVSRRILSLLTKIFEVCVDDQDPDVAG